MLSFLILKLGKNEKCHWSKFSLGLKEKREVWSPMAGLGGVEFSYLGRTALAGTGVGWKWN